MIITTSKNITKENKKLARKISYFIYSLTYHSRKNFSLEKLIKKANKKNYFSIMVLSSINKKIILNKYSYDKKLKIFKWSNKALEIEKIKFFATKKISFEHPIEIKTNNKKEKEFVRFFEIEQNPIDRLYLNADHIYEIKVENNVLKFYYDKRKLLSSRYRWLNV